MANKNDKKHTASEQDGGMLFRIFRIQVPETIKRHFFIFVFLWCQALFFGTIF
jgi:hypothetical protein